MEDCLKPARVRGSFNILLTSAEVQAGSARKNRPLSSIQEESGRFIMMRLMFQFFALASSASCTSEIMLFSCSLL